MKDHIGMTLYALALLPLKFAIDILFAWGVAAMWLRRIPKPSTDDPASIHLVVSALATRAQSSSALVVPMFIAFLIAYVSYLITDPRPGRAFTVPLVFLASAGAVWTFFALEPFGILAWLV